LFLLFTDATMPVTYLELENFKSYAGKQIIGPFQEFTSVIGPNGSGKSNLMDAISFILGVQSRHLRSSQLKDLIFRPPGDTRANLRARATLVYQDANDPNVELRFSRMISTKGTGEYQVNGKTVSFAKYEEALKNIGVLLKGRNFLVFQGDVESTARKSPKELAEWFEEISSSADLKESYNEALEKMQETEATARAAAHKQKGIWKKRRELKNQKEEAEKFQGLVESKAKLLTEFFLWQLFHIRADIEDKEGTLDELGEEMEEASHQVEEMTEKVRLAKKDASSARNATAKLEKKRVKLVSEIDKSQPSIIKVQEEVKNLEKKISVDKKNHAKITKEAESREETLQTLEKEIVEYTKTEEHLQQEYGDLKKQSEFSLTEEQEAEYERIREAAAVASAKPRQTLGAANRKLDSVRAKAATLSEESKELKARKQDVSNKVKELTERKGVLEKVSISRSGSSSCMI
jgi:Chromosome segregation ATPases